MKSIIAVVTVAMSINVYAVNNGDIPVNTADSARRMIVHLNKSYGRRYAGGRDYLKRLEAIEAKLKVDSNDTSAATELSALIREASLANPLLDFDKLLVIRRKGEANRSLNSHTTATINPKGKDNEITELSNLRGEISVRPFYRHPDQSVMKHMELHSSGERVMFSGAGSNGRWGVFDVDRNGRNLRELTPSDQSYVDWFDSCYLPEENYIVVCSTAGMQGLPCENGSMPMANLYRLNILTKEVRQLTFEQDSDWHPRIMNDGKVMYLRWEYTDTPHYFTRILFSMNPDGTNQKEYYGSGSYFPIAYVWPRPVPNSPSMVAGILSGHHAKSETGRLMVIDPQLGRKYPFRFHPDDKVWGAEKSQINIHPEVFPAKVTGCVQEIPGWGRDVVGNVYDNQGGGQKYTFGTPWPLSDKYFLVSLKGFPGTRKWVLALVDAFDNMTIVYEDPDYDLFEPIPFVATTPPPVMVDRTVAGEDAVIFCSNVYYGPGLHGIPEGKVKRLRIFSYHYGFIKSGGHESVGLESSWDIKRIIGTVPVEDDGSFCFVAPANTPISIQPLDEAGAALAIMRSWMTAMPGEALSCIGCHETQNDTAPVIKAKAASRPPSVIEPWYGPARPFSYPGEIQPVMNKYCIGCHKQGGSAPFTLAGTGSKGDGDWKKDKSYLNLAAFTRRPGPESDLELYNPMEWHATTSPLIQMLRKGHHGVRLNIEAWERLNAWIDLNVPHRGMWNNQEYEVKRLDLASRYAGVTDNPENEFRKIQAELAKSKVEPIMPAPVPKAAPDNLRAAGYPLSAAEARQYQSTAAEMEITLAGGVPVRLVKIPAGQFVMGCRSGYADEQPRAVVKIPKAFAMGATEVTCAQYAAFDPKHDNRYIDEHGKDHTTPGYIANHPDQPVARISWQEANAFCQWLSRQTGRKVRLPTEAEWEWAARAGSDQLFFYGDSDADFSRWANLADASRRRTYVRWDGGSTIHLPLNYPADWLFPLRDDRFTDHWFIVDYVRQYPANPWGLHDIIGNVSEWTASDYAPYPYNADDGRNSGKLEQLKVARGGSWNDRPVTAGSSIRFPYESYQRVYNVGFRIVIEDVADQEFSLAAAPVTVVPAKFPLNDGAKIKSQYGTITAKGSRDGGEGVVNAFDSNTATKWYHNCGSESSWIQCQLPEVNAKHFVEYHIASANDCEYRDPMDWQLLGSNDDGQSWSVLDSRKGEKFTGRFETR
ncbi:MAG: SUMF1/EgtB/PvdO family nonheme iron enzyme [Kiritimatiellae bacterium]|nr:SUMF1/EgtB/PvdO family nonheme iron enzyme [Kiritimatiellia bacterium]